MLQIFLIFSPVTSLVKSVNFLADNNCVVIRSYKSYTACDVSFTLQFTFPGFREGKAESFHLSDGFRSPIFVEYIFTKFKFFLNISINSRLSCTNDLVVCCFACCCSILVKYRFLFKLELRVWFILPTVSRLIHLIYERAFLIEATSKNYKSWLIGLIDA